jgi:CheY-like chemotaxis protein
MGRIVLIHWNAAEAKERAKSLRGAGHRVTVFTPEAGADVKKLRENPPDLFAIDLGRLPAQGRDMGIWIRQRKATRLIPIVFIGGQPEKVARIRKQLPDAVYSEWRGIRGAVRNAMQNPPKDPVVLGLMEGYSGTPLPKKLGIKAGSVVALLGAPRGFEQTLGTLPAKVQLRRQARGRADLVLLFVRSRADLNQRLSVAKRMMADGGSVWIVWPKKASGVTTDLTQNDVRRKGLDSGLVDYKIAAIDKIWSGLRFALRRR